MNDLFFFDSEKEFELAIKEAERAFLEYIRAQNPTIKCVCGADKVNHLIHSDWCLNTKIREESYAQN